jgi:membrane protein insertase, YidC/Oxa1 family, C-terminal domain
VLDGAYGFVTFLGGILAPIAGSTSAAAAIVVLTVLVRVALIPVGVSQVRAEFGRRRLAPELAALNRKYAGDRERLQRETMALYARERTSPFAGCFPLLLQAPVLSVVYALFLRDSINGHANALLAHRLFGVPLGGSLVHALGAGPAWPAVPVFAGLLVVLAGVIAVSRRVLSLQPVATSGIGAAPAQAGVGAGLARALSFMPFTTVLFAAFVPLAAGLYLLTTTSWTVCERLVLRRTLAGRQ